VLGGFSEPTILGLAKGGTRSARSASQRRRLTYDFSEKGRGGGGGGGAPRPKLADWHRKLLEKAMKAVSDALKKDQEKHVENHAGWRGVVTNHSAVFPVRTQSKRDPFDQKYRAYGEVANLWQGHSGISHSNRPYRVIGVTDHGGFWVASDHAIAFFKGRSNYSRSQYATVGKSQMIQKKGSLAFILVMLRVTYRDNEQHGNRTCGKEGNSKGDGGPWLAGRFP